MTRAWAAYAVALQFAVLSLVRDRLALLMAVFFVPVWIWVVKVTAYPTAVVFYLRAVGTEASSTIDRIFQISSALHALTVICGFMMFRATFTARDMDERLVLAGYPRPQLVLAKVTALTGASVVLSLYATVLLRLSWPVLQPAPLCAGLATAALAYGGLGILAGSLVRGELEGFFLIVMTTFLDTSLQNPVTNPHAQQTGLGALPLYGPAQAVNAAALTHTDPGWTAARALVWCALSCAAGMLAFYYKTRSFGHRTPTAPSGAAGAEAAIRAVRG
ncbi:ABC transporter permease [Streptomyces sp. SID13666]|uniref:ABC transporter permease n=1 Tax=unclassified Streptomyces TaxID=2593676 RepID=UPI0013BEC7AA|nr:MULTISPECIES: ABC transporter permease [unclassified Streptomyces]NEA54260.1 ABC transporter permease [Streptomyces sp. SID13666]NEA70355.1 ABC transporter permease [Streptomyces sp. SID13588]